MHTLYIPAGTSLFKSQVKANEREGGSKVGRRAARMLCSVGVHYVLMYERRVAATQGVSLQFTKEAPTFTRGIGIGVGRITAIRQLQAAAATNNQLPATVNRRIRVRSHSLMLREDVTRQANPRKPGEPEVLA